MLQPTRFTAGTPPVLAPFLALPDMEIGACPSRSGTPSLARKRLANRCGGRDADVRVQAGRVVACRRRLEADAGGRVVRGGRVREGAWDTVVRSAVSQEKRADGEPLRVVLVRADIGSRAFACRVED